MHELSIANQLVELACQRVRQEGVVEVRAITIRVGALTCVHSDSLTFCFDAVAENTVIAGAELKIVKVPVTVFCPNCQREIELAGIQPLCCTVCQMPCGEVRQGNELELESIEVVEQPSGFAKSPKSHEPQALN